MTETATPEFDDIGSLAQSVEAGLERERASKRRTITVVFIVLALLAIAWIWLLVSQSETSNEREAAIKEAVGVALPSALSSESARGAITTAVSDAVGPKVERAVQETVAAEVQQAVARGIPSSDALAKQLAQSGALSETLAGVVQENLDAALPAKLEQAVAQPAFATSIETAVRKEVASSVTDLVTAEVASQNKDALVKNVAAELRDDVAEQLSTSVASVDAIKSTLDESLSALRSDMAAQREGAAALAAQLSTTEQRATAAQARVDDTAAQVAERFASLENLTHAALQEREQQTAALSARLDEAELGVSETTAKLNQVTRRTAQLNAQVSSVNQTFLAQTAASQGLVGRVKEAEARLAAGEAKFEERLASLERGFQTALRARESQAVDLAERLKAAEGELAKLTAAGQRVTVLDSRLQRTDNRLTMLEGKSDLSARLAAAEQLLAEHANQHGKATCPGGSDCPEPVVIAGFRFNRAELPNTAPATESLETLAQELRRAPQRKAQIVGHTDSEGTEIANRELSLKRATSVWKQLTRLGVAPGQLTLRAAGETEPSVANDSAIARRENRRVELYVF